MKKWILTGLALMLVLSISAEVGAVVIKNETVSNGTAVVRIQGLRGAYKMLSIHPHTQDVIVSVYSGGAVIEDFTVLAGSWRMAEIAARDSVQVARATATAVDWSISTQYYTPIGGSSWTVTAFDSLVTLNSSPEPRTVTDQILIAQDLDNNEISTTGIAYPQSSGIDMNGARAAYVTIQFASFSAGDLGIEILIGPTGSAEFDTLHSAVLWDATGVIPTEYVFDSANWPTAGAMTIPITVFDGSPLGGYLHIRVSDADASLSIADVDIGVVTIW